MASPESSLARASDRLREVAVGVKVADDLKGAGEVPVAGAVQLKVVVEDKGRICKRARRSSPVSINPEQAASSTPS